MTSDTSRIARVTYNQQRTGPYRRSELVLILLLFLPSPGNFVFFLVIVLLLGVWSWEAEVLTLEQLRIHGGGKQDNGPSRERRYVVTAGDLNRRL